MFDSRLCALRASARILGFAFALAPVAMVACSASPAASPEPLREAGPAPDAAASDASAGDGGACDVGTAPTDLPTINGTFKFLPPADRPDAASAGGDAGTFEPLPTMTGGDPTGTWVFDKATFYLDAGAASLLDASTSTATGSGWIALDGSSYRIATSFNLVLQTNVAGPLAQATSSAAKGTYVVSGPVADLFAECHDGVGGTPSNKVAFTVSGARGTLITRVTGARGEITVVFEGAIRK